MRALIRVQAKYRPVSGDLQGFRIQACIPNLEARKMIRTSAGFRATDEAVPAFRRPYLIDESMDYSNESLIAENDMERFKDKLRWAGFKDFEMVTKEDKGGAMLTPERKAAVDAMLVRLGFAPF
jgi:hypothetical protein